MTARMRPAFSRLHALTLQPGTTRDALADGLRAAEAVTDRHRLSEGAVYASACRRWLLDTGEPWTRAGETTTTWGGESDHRSRASRDALSGLWCWRCSCGASGSVTDPDGTRQDALDAHAAHVAVLVPA